jgi:hypothetical protein
VPAPQYFHSQFRYRSSKQRLRRCLWLALAGLGVIGIGAAIMAPPSASKSDVAIAPRDPVFRAETIPTASPVGYAAVDPQLASERGAQVISQKPFCLGPSPSDGSCVTFQLPKVRMVRVATPRALQRRAPRQFSEAACGRRRHVGDSRDDGVQESAEVGASSEPTSQSALAQHTVTGRCPGRRLDSAGICTWRLRSPGLLA